MTLEETISALVVWVPPPWDQEDLDWDVPRLVFMSEPDEVQTVPRVE